MGEILFFAEIVTFVSHLWEYFFNHCFIKHCKILCMIYYALWFFNAFIPSLKIYVTIDAPVFHSYIKGSYSHHISPLGARGGGGGGEGARESAKHKDNGRLPSAEWISWIVRLVIHLFLMICGYTNKCFRRAASSCSSVLQRWIGGKSSTRMRFQSRFERRGGERSYLGTCKVAVIHPRTSRLGRDRIPRVRHPYGCLNRQGQTLSSPRLDLLHGTVSPPPKRLSELPLSTCRWRSVSEGEGGVPRTSCACLSSSGR